MKLTELSFDFLNQEPAPQRSMPKKDPERVARLVAMIKMISDSHNYEAYENALKALDMAIAPYDEDDKGNELPPVNPPRVAYDLSDIGVEHVITRVQTSHYGARRIDKLEKELNEISDRINIH